MLDEALPKIPPDYIFNGPKASHKCKAVASLIDTFWKSLPELKKTFEEEADKAVGHVLRILLDCEEGREVVRIILSESSCFEKASQEARHVFRSAVDTKLHDLKETDSALRDIAKLLGIDSTAEGTPNSGANGKHESG